MRAPELLEGEDVGVYSAPSYDVAAGRRELDLAEAREEGAGEEDGGPDLARLLGRDVGAAKRARVDAPCVGAERSRPRRPAA